VTDNWGDSSAAHAYGRIVNVAKKNGLGLTGVVWVFFVLSFVASRFELF